MHFGRLSFTEAWNMPVEIRKWWFEKVVKLKEKDGSAKKKHVDPFGKEH